MSNYNAIHFDMDGVLANTEPLHVAAEQQTCRGFNFAIDPAKWGGFKGQTAEAIFSYLLNEYGDPSAQTVDDLINHKTKLFTQLATAQLEPIDGSLEFLQWARDTHETVTLVTSSNRRVQELIIGSFGVTHMFDSIVTGDDITNGKPNPEPYLTSLARTGTLPETSVVIEDSKSGIQSALAAKCSVLAIATSHMRAELVGSRPTYIEDDFKDARRQMSS